MSTRPDATTTGTPSPRPDEPTQFSQSAPSSDAHESPPTDVSWTARCQQQFDSGDSTRCTNLADEANEAMHDGV